MKARQIIEKLQKLLENEPRLEDVEILCGLEDGGILYGVEDITMDFFEDEEQETFDDPTIIFILK